MNDQIRALIAQHEKERDFTHVAPTDEMLAAAQRLLGVQLPQQFVDYLNEYSHGGVGGVEILGVGLTGTMLFLEVTLDYRKYGLPHNLLAVENSGAKDSPLPVVGGLHVVATVTSSNKCVTFGRTHGPPLCDASLVPAEMQIASKIERTREGATIDLKAAPTARIPSWQHLGQVPCAIDEATNFHHVIKGHVEDHVVPYGKPVVGQGPLACCLVDGRHGGVRLVLEYALLDVVQQTFCGCGILKHIPDVEHRLLKIVPEEGKVLEPITLLHAEAAP